MNSISQLLNRIVKRAGTRYACSEISKDEMIACRIRVERLRDRHNWLKLRRRARAARERRQASLDELRAVIARGGTIVAFDTEFTQEGPVEQLGISTWRNHQISTRTYTVSSLSERYTDRPSLFGEAHTATRSEIKQIAAQAYAEADLNVFHSYMGDAEKLGLDLSSNRYVDTSRVSHLLKGSDIPGLKDICAHYEIAFQGHHNAGNDAHHTLLAVLAIAADTWEDQLRDEPEVQASNLEQRRVMMYPTRLPIPDPVELNRIRQIAQLAYDRFCDRMRRDRKQRDGQSIRAARRKKALAKFD